MSRNHEAHRTLITQTKESLMASSLTDSSSFVLPLTLKSFKVLFHLGNPSLLILWPWNFKQRGWESALPTCCHTPASDHW